MEGLLLLDGDEDASGPDQELAPQGGVKIAAENAHYEQDNHPVPPFAGQARKRHLDNDTCLFKIMKLMKRKGDPNDRALLDYLKNEIQEEGRAWWGAVDRDEDGSQRFLTQEEVEDLILYGEIIHTNKKDDLQRVIGKGSYLKAAAFFNYMRFVRTVVNGAQKTAELIRLKGYLA